VGGKKKTLTLNQKLEKKAKQKTRTLRNLPSSTMVTPYSFLPSLLYGGKKKGAGLCVFFKGLLLMRKYPLQ
jgi:hypothetical protein